MKYSARLRRFWRICTDHPYSFLFLFFIVSLVLRCWFYFHNLWPHILGDELTDKLMSENWARTGVFTSGYDIYASTDHPNRIYPALMAIPIYFHLDYYKSLKVISSVLVGFTVFPAFFIARKVISVEKALIVALLTGALNCYHFASMSMVESLLYPSMLLLFLCAAKTLFSANFQNYFLSGVVSAFCLGVKPTSLAPVCAVIAFFFIWDLLKTRTWKSAISHQLIFLCSLVVTLLIYYGLFFEHNRQAPLLGNSYSSAAGWILGTSDPWKMIRDLLQVGAGFFSTTLFLFPLPIFFAFRSVLSAYRKKNWDSLSGLLLLALLMVFSLMALAIKFNASCGEPFLLHMRYLTPIFPIAITLYCSIGTQNDDETPSLKLCFAFALFYCLVTFVFYKNYLTKVPESFFTTNMEQYWLTTRPHRVAAGFLLTPIVLIFSLRLKRKEMPFQLSVAWLAIVLCLGNVACISWIKTGGRYSRERYGPTADCIASVVPSNSNEKVAFVTGKSVEDIIFAEGEAFHFSYDYRYLGSDLRPIPSDTDWLIVLRKPGGILPSSVDWRLMNAEKNLSGNCQIYRRNKT